MAAVAPVMFSMELVTPEYGAALGTLANPLPVFTFHWYERPVPVAPTEKLVLFPAQIARLPGCVPIEGAVQEEQPNVQLSGNENTEASFTVQLLLLKIAVRRLEGESEVTVQL